MPRIPNNTMSKTDSSTLSILFFLVGLCWRLLTELPRAESFVVTSSCSSSNGCINARKLHHFSFPIGNSSPIFLQSVVEKYPHGETSNDNDSSSSSSCNEGANFDNGGFFWDFRGHSCYAEIVQPSIFNDSEKNKKEAKNPVVILVHGFACSTVYWRETRAYLSKEGYTIHSVDLLGQGKSAKPGRADNIVYSIDLWAQMVDEYARQHVLLDDDQNESGVVLVGNSLGSLVALSAATGDCFNDDSVNNPTNGGYLSSRVKGLCMFNCGVGLNTKNVLKVKSNSPWLKSILSVVFSVLDLVVFGNKALLTYLIDNQVSN